jgi:hypothetical protein
MQDSLLESLHHFNFFLATMNTLHTVKSVYPRARALAYTFAYTFAHTFACALVCVIMAACSPVIAPVSNDDLQAAQTFLASNNQAIDLSSNASTRAVIGSLSLLDPVLAQHEIFMAGEYHSVAANEEVNFALLRYFHERAGVRYLLPEFSYGFCELINTYLDNGDESLLRWLYGQLRGTAAYHREGFEFWRKLRAFNQSLPAEQRIRVVGTDIEHQNVTGLRYFNTLLPSTATLGAFRADIRAALDGVSGLFRQNFSSATLKQRCEVLRTSIDENRGAYQQYFGEKFFQLDFMTDNLLQTTDAQSRQGRDFNRVRDNYLYANFLRIYPTLPQGKFYGEWGRSHVFLTRPNDNILWNGSMFSNDARSPVRGKVLSIPYFYKDCNIMSRDNGASNPLNDYTSQEGLLEPFLAASPSATTAQLFRFVATNPSGSQLASSTNTGTQASSPFSRALFWFSEDTSWKRSGAVTTSYFQYCVVMQRSPATTLFVP